MDRTLVFSGDTGIYPGMEEVYAGADVLFHEAYSFDPKTNPYDAKAPVTVAYMNAFHTSTEDLAGQSLCSSDPHLVLSTTFAGAILYMKTIGARQLSEISNSTGFGL